MILKANILVCDNEHGTGDVVFPDLTKLEGFELAQHCAKGWTGGEVRRQAKAEGWCRHNGVDYCPACADSINSQQDEKP